MQNLVTKVDLFLIDEKDRILANRLHEIASFKNYSLKIAYQGQLNTGNNLDSKLVLDLYYVGRDGWGVFYQPIRHQIYHDASLVKTDLSIKSIFDSNLFLKGEYLIKVTLKKGLYNYLRLYLDDNVEYKDKFRLSSINIYAKNPLKHGSSILQSKVKFNSAKNKTAWIEIALHKVTYVPIFCELTIHITNTELGYQGFLICGSRFRMKRNEKIILAVGWNFTNSELIPTGNNKLSICYFGKEVGVTNILIN